MGIQQYRLEYDIAGFHQYFIEHYDTRDDVEIRIAVIKDTFQVIDYRVLDTETGQVLEEL